MKTYEAGHTTDYQKRLVWIHSPLGAQNGGSTERTMRRSGEKVPERDQSLRQRKLARSRVTGTELEGQEMQHSGARAL